MHLNRVFELSMTLDSDRFDEVFSQSYCGEDYADEDEYVDRSMASRGIVVKYRASQYKKRIKLIVDAATITGGAITDADKLVRKLEKHIDKYFDSSYRLEDFTVSGLTLTTALDVGSREDVAAYLHVLQRIGKVSWWDAGLQGHSASRSTTYKTEGDSKILCRIWHCRANY